MIARRGSGDDSEATVGIIGMAAPDRESCGPIERGWPVDANHGLPLRAPQQLEGLVLLEELAAIELRDAFNECWRRRLVA